MYMNLGNIADMNYEIMFNPRKYYHDTFEKTTYEHTNKAGSLQNVLKLVFQR